MVRRADSTTDECVDEYDDHCVVYLVGSFACACSAFPFHIQVIVVSQIKRPVRPNPAEGAKTPLLLAVWAVWVGSLAGAKAGEEVLPFEPNISILLWVQDYMRDLRKEKMR